DGAYRALLTGSKMAATVVPLRLGPAGPRSRILRCEDRPGQAKKSDSASSLSYSLPQAHWVAADPGTMCGTPVGSEIQYLTWDCIDDGRVPIALMTDGHCA